MENNNLIIREPDRLVKPVGARNMMAIGFRRRKLLAASFVLVFLAVLAAALLLPPSYESEMKILVKKSRIDPVVSPGQPPGMLTHDGISEEELNSEVELLKSTDLLREVVLATGMHLNQKPSLRARLLRANASDSEIKIARAVRTLSNKLTVEPSKKSNIIVARYSAGDPNQAANVLQALSKVYIQKHLDLRQGTGELKFFDEETEKYRQRLAEAERKLAEFPREGGTVAGALERDITVQKLGDLKMTLQQTQAAMTEAKKRIASLEAQTPAEPRRITTVVRTAENPQLMQQLKGTLLTLELKRTELLQKFKPSYRAVQDVDKQIAETRSAIAKAEKSPMRDETTDRDPTYEWARAELAKARTELRALQGRAAATTQAIAEFEENARKLNESSIAQQNLLREAKALEEGYQMYLKKHEEARIANALDRSKIFNVQVAQPPTVPALPTRSLAMYLMAGLVLALVAGTGCVLIAEHLDQSFRTPYEVQQYLDIPVLAALPKGNA